MRRVLLCLLPCLVLGAGCFRYGFEEASDGGLPMDAGQDAGLDGSTGGDDGGPVSSLLITAPNGGSDDEWFETVVVVRGTCSEDVRDLSTDLGQLDDDDCSDGTWSLAPFSLDYPPGPRVFTVHGTGAQGSLEASISVDYTYVRLAQGSSTVYTRNDPYTLAGHCSPAVVSMTTSYGVFIDVDCSDFMFLVEMDFPSGEGLYPVQVEGTDVRMRSQTDDTTVVFDTIAPEAPVVLASSPASPDEENFPLISGDAEAYAGIQLFLDSGCGQAASLRSAPWANSFWNEGMRVMVVDGTSNGIHANAMDRAGNLSACSSVPLGYQDATAVQQVPCDLNLGGHMSFAEFQDALDRAQGMRDVYLDDGVLVVCLEEGAIVETSCAAEGGRIRIPGDDILVFCPGGTAQVVNRRADTDPSADEAQGGLWLDGVERVALSNLDVTVEGASGAALAAQDGSIRFLRDVNFKARRCAVEFPSEPLTMRLAEMRACSLRATTAMHVRNARIGLIDDCQFYFDGGGGLNLDNSNILIGEIRDSLISSEDPEAGGVGINIHTANRSASIQKMTGCTLERTPLATAAGGTAIWFRNYESDSTYVSTPNFRDNHFCGPWAVLLNPEPGPTQAWDPTRCEETNGTDSVPWGDTRHAAENPGFNWQATWGGDCP